MLGRKDLFKNTLRKAAYAMKRIIELRLSGGLYSFFSLSLVSILLISSMGGCLILFFFATIYRTEEEASMLRSFVDEPAFIDLHWVQLNFLSW